MRSPDRGPSKAGKKALTVHLTDEELRAFSELAEANCRSGAGQLLWLVRQAISGPTGRSTASESLEDAFARIRAGLEDYRGQNRLPVTKQTIAAYVREDGYSGKEAMALRKRLEGLFL